MLLRLLPLTLSFILVASPIAAQERSKRVEDLLKQADKLAQLGGVQHVQAETLYEEALALAPDDALVHLRMGLCQLNGPFRHKALHHLLRARELGPDLPRINYLVGFAHHLNAEWDLAIAAFEEHKRVRDPRDTDPLYADADDHLRQCRNGRALSAAPVPVQVRNLGAGINSSASDHGPLISADGRTLFFTSRRPSPGNSRVNKATGEYFEDIHVVERSDDGWGVPQQLPPPLNGPANDASVGLSADGRTILLYRDQGGAGDLFESDRSSAGWSEPRPLGSTINGPGHESAAWRTADGRWLYFVSDRVDNSVGGQDIFRAPWDDASSTWGTPENLGPTVNSRYDEDGVFLTRDGGTLYFSSKGHNSMGGFDIFRTRLVDGQWTKPENLGWPINSPDDDLFFVLTDDGSRGYFSSLRADGQGEDDIHEVLFSGE
ncbi:MAG: hypothetical protein R2817_02320 [Flavobacteriales bacterium]